MVNQYIGVASHLLSRWHIQIKLPKSDIRTQKRMFWFRGIFRAQCVRKAVELVDKLHQVANPLDCHGADSSN